MSIVRLAPTNGSVRKCGVLASEWVEELKAAELQASSHPGHPVSPDAFHYGKVLIWRGAERRTCRHGRRGILDMAGRASGRMARDIRLTLPHGMVAG